MLSTTNPSCCSLHSKHYTIYDNLLGLKLVSCDTVLTSCFLSMTFTKAEQKEAAL